MTREDIVAAIASSLRRSLRFLSEGQARAAADTVLRDIKAMGVRLVRRRDG
jgi:hypothetical protein